MSSCLLIHTFLSSPSYDIENADFDNHSVKEAMRELLNKYPLGYEGCLVEKGLVPPVDQVAGNFSVVQANMETLVEEFRDTDMQARA